MYINSGIYSKLDEIVSVKRSSDGQNGDFTMSDLKEERQLWLEAWDSLTPEEK